jgi:hypothetical protein
MTYKITLILIVLVFWTLFKIAKTGVLSSIDLERLEAIVLQKKSLLLKRNKLIKT